MLARQSEKYYQTEFSEKKARRQMLHLLYLSLLWLNSFRTRIVVNQTNAYSTSRRKLINYITVVASILRLLDNVYCTYFVLGIYEKVSCVRAQVLGMTSSTCAYYLDQHEGQSVVLSRAENNCPPAAVTPYGGCDLSRPAMIREHMLIRITPELVQGFFSSIRNWN